MTPPVVASWTARPRNIELADNWITPAAVCHLETDSFVWPRPRWQFWSLGMPAERRLEEVAEEEVTKWVLGRTDALNLPVSVARRCCSLEVDSPATMGEDGRLSNITFRRMDQALLVPGHRTLAVQQTIAPGGIGGFRCTVRRRNQPFHLRQCSLCCSLDKVQRRCA